MRLTRILFSKRPEFQGHVPKYPGSVLTGKHRFVPPVHRGAKYVIWTEMMHEEETMKYLKNPYITELQEQAYLQSQGRSQPEYRDDFMGCRVIAPIRQRYAADLISQLDVSRKFEENE